MSNLIAFLKPKHHFDAFVEIVAILKRHSELTRELVKREMSERYAGQVLGSLWTVIHPLIQISVYIFIFVYVFRVKIGGTADMPLDYTTYILAGLIPWLSAQESMNKASIVIANNVNLVKQVIFPIEILPVKGVLVSLVTQLISTSFLIVYVLVTHNSLHLTYLLLPILIVVHALMVLGICFVLSAAGGYFKDIKDIVQVFGTIGLYLVPVFYLPEQIPVVFRPFLYLNPFSYLIWCYQDVIYFGRFEHPWAWPVVILLSYFVFTTGYRSFRKAKTLIGNFV